MSESVRRIGAALDQLVDVDWAAEIKRVDDQSRALDSTLRIVDPDRYRALIAAMQRIREVLAATRDYCAATQEAFEKLNTDFVSNSLFYQKRNDATEES